MRILFCVYLSMGEGFHSSTKPRALPHNSSAALANAFSAICFLQKSRFTSSKLICAVLPLVFNLHIYLFLTYEN